MKRIRPIGGYCPFTPQGGGRTPCTVSLANTALNLLVFAFILGVVPLMLSEGAGAEMRRTLGTATCIGRRRRGVMTRPEHGVGH